MPINFSPNRFARVLSDGKPIWAMLEGDAVFELQGEFLSPRRGELIASWNQASFLAPVEISNKIIGLLDNFDGKKDRKGPGLFFKPSTAVIGQGADITWPAGVTSVNFEAELAVVIGKRGKNVPVREAFDHVLGYTIANDITSFDVLMEDGVQSLSTRFKAYDAFMPLGPCIVSGLNGDDLMLRSRLNGETKQEISTSKMAFNIAEVIAWVSAVMTLEPGDIISMGTPPGFVPMALGDIIECEIEGIGILKNRLISPPIQAIS